MEKKQQLSRRNRGYLSKTPQVLEYIFCGIHLQICLQLTPNPLGICCSLLQLQYSPLKTNMNLAITWPRCSYKKKVLRNDGNNFLLEKEGPGEIQHFIENGVADRNPLFVLNSIFCMGLKGFMRCKQPLRAMY